MHVLHEDIPIRFLRLYILLFQTDEFKQIKSLNTQFRFQIGKINETRI